MLMPKAAVYENGEPMFRQHEIGTPRQINPAQSKAQTQTMSNAPDE
jgi:hypothetical protein